MAKDDVDQSHVRISVIPPADSTLKQLDDIYIVITQAFCPNGHNLVMDDNSEFDGYPGIKVYLETPEETGEVILSPFHGDSSKKGKTDWKDGTRLKMMCPICKTDLPKLASCRCDEQGNLVKAFLTPSLSDSHILAICNIWGCRRSRTIDNWQIISEYLDGQIAD